MKPQDNVWELDKTGEKYNLRTINMLDPFQLEKKTNDGGIEVYLGDRKRCIPMKSTKATPLPKGIRR